MQASGPSVQGVLTEAIAALCGRAGRRSAAPAAPTPACMRSARSPMSISPRTGTPTPCATRSMRICGRIPVAVLAAEKVAGRLRRALLGDQAALPLSHRQPPRRPRARARPRLARAAPARCTRRCTRPRSGSSASTTSRPSASTECQAKSPVKTLDRLDVDARRRRDRASTRRRARSCTHQVRSMVGSLVLVGEGKWSADDLAAALAARDRAACGRSRRRRGFIWCAWTTERRHARSK